MDKGRVIFGNSLGLQARTGVEARVRRLGQGWGARVRQKSTVLLDLLVVSFYYLRLSILPGLCADVILGQDFQQQHASVTLNCGGKLPPIVLCGLTTLCVNP